MLYEVGFHFFKGLGFFCGESIQAHCLWGWGMKIVFSCVVRSHCVYTLYTDVSRSVVQLVEHRSPKPGVVGSSPSAPATLDKGGDCS